MSLIPILALFLPLLPARAESYHTDFRFNQMRVGEIILMKDASFVSTAIRLTDESDQSLGRTIYSNFVDLQGPVSFSTTFVFSMVPRPGMQAGHGMAFMMTPLISLLGSVGNQYLGLLNISTNGQPSNHLFAVEFDTAQNIEFEDINDNHVGVDFNSLISAQAEPAGYWRGQNEREFQPLRLNSGQNLQAWIDYRQNQVNVSIAVAGLQKPIRPLISLDADLSDILQDRMFVGFTAATGTFFEEHYVLAWSFSTNGTAAPLDVSRLPSFMCSRSADRSPAFKWGIGSACLVSFLLVAAAVCLWSTRRRYRELVEDWELEYWPHRFPYKELSVATKGFAEEGLLGAGGCGKVYKGVLPGSGLEVAVKCISKEVVEGMKEFIAEISTMGRLQHRNLVQLRGWSRRNKQLFIVYDYMPHGSLDARLLGTSGPALAWPQRYAILKGMAAGLLYLHHQWEQRVVHRDIKSSNVLLDSELNGRLSDFGLARLYDHSQNPETTHVFGTLGYIAPELIHTAKATPSSDVFSFGVVALEVASGRRPLDQSKQDEEAILVDWVWDLYAKERLMDAVDPRLGGEFDAEEMNKVLRLGLYCSYPEPQGRPNMKQVLQILEGEVPPPLLQMPLFNPSIRREHSCIPVTEGSQDMRLFSESHDGESSVHTNLHSSPI